MPRSRLILVVAVVLSMVPASLWASAPAASLATAQRAVTVHRLGDSAAATRSYWTPRRMRRAVPADIVTSATSGARGPATSVTSELGPGSIAPTAPEGTITLPSSSVGPADEVSSHMPLASFTSGALPTADYRTFPYSTIGRVFFTDPTTNQNYACSGTALTSENESVVWTAGHCVHGGGAGEVFYTNWAFIPSYVDHTRPVGTWPALVTMAPAQWISSGNLRYDMAAAVVGTLGGHRLTEVTGGRGIQWNLSNTQTFTPYGYPAAAPFTGERILYCTSDLLSTGNPGGSGPPTLGIGCDMTEGSSGGGWIVGDQFVNSNVSYGIEGKPNVFYGPYFGDAAATLYQSAATSTLPGPLPADPPVDPPVDPPIGGTPSPTPTGTPTETPAAMPAPTPSPSPTPSSPPGDTIAPELSVVVDRPDPFSPNGDGVKDKVKILFTLSEPSHVTITILKPSGSLLGTLVSADAPEAARYKARWNGKVGRSAVRNGTYRYVIVAVDAAGNKASARGTTTVDH
jgi:V8-like Glu-specific endopeptidase